MPDQSQPLWLYFTPRGQVSGVATLFYSHIVMQPQNLINLGYIVPYPNGGDGVYYVSVGFRSATDACSNYTFAQPLGDRLVIHPTGVAMSLPLTASDASSQGWVVGSCFGGMGRHWFLDLSSPGSMTWRSDWMLPVVTMYDEDSPSPTGNINAIFFASRVVQQSLVPPATNQWEPVPLPNLLMCKNFCNSSCTFYDTSFYSTLHIYMNNRSRITCHNGCTIGCC